MSETEPFVFIIDLDGTIIGDCSYQVVLYNIEQILKENSVKVRNDKMLFNSYLPETKLVRPYFKLFIDKIKSSFPNSLFYVYTASETSWANKEIQIIENTNNFKFNRPIFTRKNCKIDSSGNFVKLVSLILPTIKKRNNKMTIKDEKILVIDNNDVFRDFRENFLLCPSYEHIVFCNILNKIDKSYLQIKELKDFIQSLIKENKVFEIPYKNKFYNDKISERYHRWLYKKYKELNKYNKKYANDIFWKKLTDIIVNKNMLTFNKQNMLELRNSV